MYLQGVESIYDIVWAQGPSGKVTYGDVYHQTRWNNRSTTSISPIPAFC